MRKLIAAARLDTPGDHVPYAFENRIMARLRSMKPLDAGAFWSRAMWYGAGACAGIALAVSAWSAVLAIQSNSADFSQDFEQTVFAMVSQENDSW